MSIKETDQNRNKRLTWLRAVKGIPGFWWQSMLCVCSVNSGFNCWPLSCLRVTHSFGKQSCLFVFIQWALPSEQLNPTSISSKGVQKKEEGIGEEKSSIFSVYAWTGHEQLLLCPGVPQRHHTPGSVFRVNEDCGVWDLEGIAMVRSAAPQSQHNLLSGPLHLSKMGINSISLCQGRVSRTETIKV